jgi:hypothetical protein
MWAFSLEITPHKGTLQKIFTSRARSLPYLVFYYIFLMKRVYKKKNKLKRLSAYLVRIQKGLSRGFSHPKEIMKVNFACGFG